jgi:hypothetical protein
MAVERIGGAADPRVAPFRDVPDAERLRSQGLFVAEGRLIVARILEDPRHRVRAVLVNDASYRELATAFDRLPGTCRSSWRIAAPFSISPDTTCIAAAWHSSNVRSRRLPPPSSRQLKPS